MNSLDQIREKVEELSKRYKVASNKKSTLSGLLQAKKEELAALKSEIEEAGYDPKRLKEERDRLQQEVITMMEDFDKKLGEVEAALLAFGSSRKNIQVKITTTVEALTSPLEIANIVKPKLKGSSDSAFLIASHGGKLFIHSHDGIRSTTTELKFDSLEGEGGFAFPSDKIGSLKFVEGWI